MAKQEIDIGVEGNDGTGDSIRESFRKVNENFNEIYAVFGLGGQISFTNLNDTPDTLIGNEGKVVLVKPDGTGVDFYELVSNAGTNNPSDPNNTVSFDFTTEPGKLIIKSINTKLSTDPAPSALNPLKINSAAAYSPTAQNLLLSDIDRSILVNNFNATHGTPFINEDNLVISKGFADSKYLRTVGGALTGPLTVPAGATGDEVPRVDEVVKKSGDVMTGPLTLFDHPYPFNGVGTPNSEFDLQAASKFYVDSSSYSSTVNLFVTTNGNDAQTLTPAGKEGRSEGYSYKSIAAACAKAERLQQSSPIDIGPYVQTITHQDNGETENSYIFSSNFGYTTFGDQASVISTINSSKNNVISTAIDNLETEFPDFIFDESVFVENLSTLLESIKFDIGASTVSVRHNYLTRFAGLRYYENPANELLISESGAYAQTVYLIQHAKLLLLASINTALGAGDNSGNYWYISVSNLFDTFLQIIDKTTDDPALVESSNYYNILIYSGPNKFTDQSGDPTVDNPNIDIIPGKIIRGKTTNAIGLILSYQRGFDTSGIPSYDTVELQMLTPFNFIQNEELEYGNLVRQNQITIRVESGIYNEQLPIRVPENTSIKGDEFRRVIIRPASGISTSPHARTYFYRDATIDGNTTASAGELVIQGDTVGYFGYHYLSDPSDIDSTPKQNNQMDVFLMNDATILRNITCQRHGGFMMVLDPTGSIQTRSPYAQTCTSFSQSVNRKTFSGGMFIDGYTYSMPITITGKLDNFNLEIEAPSDSGLGLRKPKMPCSFFINGRRYQVNAIKDYNPDVGGFALGTLVLDRTSNFGEGFVDAVDSPGGATDVVLQGAGNKSMLANDYTQINDLGYGIVANNNALAELVSVFTYYCNVGYYSRNGSQIRSLTGNNSYGNFGLVSEGSDPDEQARPAVLAQNLVQPVKVYTIEQEVTVSNDVSALLTIGETIKQEQTNTTITGNLGFFTVNDNDTTTLYVENLTGGKFNFVDEIFDESSTSLGAPVGITNRDFTGKQGDTSIYIYDLTDFPLNVSEIEVLHTSGVYVPYDIVSVSDSTILIPESVEGVLCQGSNTAIRRKIWRLDLNIGVTSTTTSGLREEIEFGTVAVYRAKQNLLLDGITAEVLTRPSTALVFNENPNLTYRTLAFENTIISGIPVTGTQSKVTIDDNFGYIDLNVNNSRAAYGIGSINYSIDSTTGQTPFGGTTLGRNAGDRNVAILELGADDISRIVGKIFTWAGKLHIITGYSIATDISGTPGLTGNKFGIATFSDLYNINPDFSGAGLAQRADSAISENISLKAGIATGEEGTVTVNISTCRATSHDFLDIGTGGYNTTNYPDRIYGSPAVNAVTDGEAIDSRGFNSKAQVQERTKGRCFFASTDQDGFFRVGRFFTVDQGTGTISFNAALVLTNIDGLGFKRGVPIREFTPDTTFTNATGDSVPTTTAVEGYINRRLGWSRTGESLNIGDIIGGGAIRKAGDNMTGPLSMSNNQITNLQSPTVGSDAANKTYVDAQITSINEINKLNDIEFAGLESADLMIYNNTTGKWNNVAFSNDKAISDITFSYNTNTGVASAQINTGTIINADIDSNAAISQSKLNLQPAITRLNDSNLTQGDLGLSVFDSSQFVTSGIDFGSGIGGFVSIKDEGISNAKLAGSISNDKLINSAITISDGTSSTSIPLGNTITFVGEEGKVVVSESSGTITISLDTEVVAGAAQTLVVESRNNENATHYLTFVTSTNGELNFYTDTGLQWNPESNRLTLIDGELLGLNKLSFTGTNGNNEFILPTNLSNAFTIKDNAITPNDILTIKTTTGNAEVSIDGFVSLTGNILPGTNAPTNSGQEIGSLTRRWATVYATVFNGTATEALYADLAENYLGDSNYEPGTVLVFGGTEEVTVTNQKGDRRVAGIVTTNPAHLMNSHLTGDHVIGVALQGRVPCKVLGRVEKGDMLVTSAIPGYAIVNNDPKIGSIIGKAVGIKTDDGYGTVEVVVGRS